jgi:hypothetical protein
MQIAVAKQRKPLRNRAQTGKLMLSAVETRLLRDRHGRYRLNADYKNRIGP